MKLIPLSQGNFCKNKKEMFFAKVDDEDFYLVNKFKWYAHKNKSNNWYACYGNQHSDIRLRMHRFILELKKEDKIIVDHIDGDGLNNQKNNIRICTHSQNRINKGNDIV